MLRKTKIITILLIIVTLLVLTASGFYWYGISRSFPIEKIGKVSLTPGQGIKLGQLVTAKVTVKCPWRRHPVTAVANISKGCREISEPVIARQAIKPGYALWKISVPFKPFRTGEISKSKLQITFNRDKTGRSAKDNHSMQLTIPAFKVQPLPLTTGASPTIAGKVDEIVTLHGWRKYWLWIVAGALLVVLAVVTIMRRRTGKTIIIITPWERALSNLGGLRRELASGQVDLGICFSRLTDIVRLYLEQRFSLKSSKQTTYEFLAELKQPSSPLENAQRDFLQQFMQAADLVKFAKLPPEAEQLNNALDKAELLIKETQQHEAEVKR